MLSVRLCWAALLFAPAFLNACAPSATTSTVQNSRSNMLVLAPGQSATVSLRVSLDALEVDDSQAKELDVDFDNKDAFGRVQDKEKAVSWFKVKGVRSLDDVVSGTAASGWAAALDSAFLGYEITKNKDNGSGQVNSVQYRPYIRLVLRVTAPAGAKAGTALLDVEVQNINGKTGDAPLYVTVKP